MALKVDTFEHDIADEIRRKEATLEEVKAVAKSTDPSNQVIPPKKLPVLTITLSVTIIVALLGIGGVAYYYFHDVLLPPSSKPIAIQTRDIPKITAEVTKLSPALGVEIGRFVNVVEKKDTGYIISINDYSAVFAYMTRNEDTYIGDLAKLFTVAEATTTPVLPEIKSEATTTPVTSTSTQTSTSTKIVPKATSTKTTTSTTKTKTMTKATTTEAKPENLSAPTPIDIVDSNAINQHYSDLTVSNQNMRVYKNGKQMVIYSFVGTAYVLISNTPEGILALRGGILR